MAVTAFGKLAEKAMRRVTREVAPAALSRSFAVWRAFGVFRRFFGLIYRETLSQQGR